MQALNDYMIISEIKENKIKKDELIMNDVTTNDIRYIKGEIISVGNGIETDKLKNGDIIFYDKHAGFGVEYKSKLYKVIKLRDAVMKA